MGGRERTRAGVGRSVTCARSSGGVGNLPSERGKLRHYSCTNAVSPEFCFIFTPVFHTVGYVSERLSEGFVAGSDGNWHETLHDEDAPAGSSDRAFGLLFTAIAGVLAALSAWKGRHGALGW